MVLVRLETSPLWILVWVLESLQVPLSCARAFAMPFMVLALPCSLVELLSRVPPAALPPVPPTPRVEAEVPPAAALPPVPPVALVPDALPAPIADALCATASEPAPARRAPASRAVLMVRISPHLF